MSILRNSKVFWCRGVRGIHGYSRIGKRDVVGHGCNGNYCYKDDALFPFPAIRFKENTPDIEALREKEKEDWKLLCKADKKALYRASFCQTFAEFQYPTSHWKFVLGGVLFVTSTAFWIQIFYSYFVNEPLPESLSEMRQRAQLKRILDLKVNPIDGISSKWDYENDRWKIYSLTPGYQKITYFTSDQKHSKVYVPIPRLVREVHGRCRIGNRDVVGHGCNGSYCYKDDAHFPFPAVRFRQNSVDVVAARQKEVGDWKMLTIEEKKRIYRASFCQTFAEFQHNTGSWKFVLGYVLVTTSFGFWAMMFYHFYDTTRCVNELTRWADSYQLSMCQFRTFYYKAKVFSEPLPISLSQLSQKHQLRRMIELHVNPIDGLSSLWDYERELWKWQVKPKEETPKRKCA